MAANQLFDQEEMRRLEVIARKRGYSAPSDYLRALVNADAAGHNEYPLFEDEDDIEDIRESIKQGLREALDGQGVPIDEVWSALDDE